MGFSYGAPSAPAAAPPAYNSARAASPDLFDSCLCEAAVGGDDDLDDCDMGSVASANPFMDFDQPVSRSRAVPMEGAAAVSGAATTGGPVAGMAGTVLPLPHRPELQDVVKTQQSTGCWDLTPGVVQPLLSSRPVAVADVAALCPDGPWDAAGETCVGRGSLLNQAPLFSPSLVVRVCSLFSLCSVPLMRMCVAVARVCAGVTAAAKSQLWATALCIAALRQRFADKRSEWVLVERKALRWLNRAVADAVKGPADAAVAALLAGAVAALAGL